VKIGVVGAGAIGTIFGASLARTHDVHVLVRDAKTSRTIANRGGLVIDDLPPSRVDVSHDPDHLTDCELLIVAVKAYATIDALEPLRTRLKPEATIVSIQNGIDAAAQIEYALGHRHAVAVGPTMHAARLLEPGVVARAAAGPTVLGWVAGHARERAELEAIAAAFTESELPTQTVDDSRPALWRKLVINAAINPITALAGVSNGELLAHAALLERAAAIAREVAELARREGIALSLPGGDPVASIVAAARATAANRSSMLQDLERGRRTEIDTLLGTVLRRAAAFGLAVPACQAAYDEVRRRTTA
jgi:2-dehydropantoate 2-reductase